jgi:hypothetical protein
VLQAPNCAPDVAPVRLYGAGRQFELGRGSLVRTSRDHKLQHLLLAEGEPGDINQDAGPDAMAQIADRLTHPRDQAESGRERTRDKDPKEQLLHDLDQHITPCYRPTGLIRKPIESPVIRARMTTIHSQPLPSGRLLTSSALRPAT